MRVKYLRPSKSRNIFIYIIKIDTLASDVICFETLRFKGFTTCTLSVIFSLTSPITDHNQGFLCKLNEIMVSGTFLFLIFKPGEIKNSWFVSSRVGFNKLCSAKTYEVEVNFGMF